MKKWLIIGLLCIGLVSLVGCQSNKPTTNPTVIETEGDQTGIFDAISESLKQLFD